MAEPSWAVKMLGPELLTHADPTKPTGVLRPTDEVLAQKKFVILYFSASWCPPCKKFTSFFSIVYEDMLEGADKDEVEVRARCLAAPPLYLARQAPPALAFTPTFTSSTRPLPHPNRLC